MSISTYKGLIDSCLQTNGYRQIPENRVVDDVSMVNNHLSYSLKWIGTNGLTSLSADRMMWSNVFLLEVKYKGINSTEREANAELFIQLLEAITGITGFMGFADEGSLDDIDNKHTKATLKIIIGAESNC